MGTHVRGGEGVKIRLAEQLRQRRKVALQGLGEAAAVGAGVNAEARGHRHARRAEDVSPDGVALAQQVVLKIPLDAREAAHEPAATARRGRCRALASAVEPPPSAAPSCARVRAHSARACASSAHNSASGGM